MAEGAQNLQQQIQEQTMKSAQDFYGDSLGRIEGQLQNDRAQPEGLAEQSPPDAQAQLQEMVDSYSEISGGTERLMIIAVPYPVSGRQGRRRGSGAPGTHPRVRPFFSRPRIAPHPSRRLATGEIVRLWIGA